MERLILAYCHENFNLANHIDEKLRRTGIRIDHVTDLQDRLPGQFVAAIQASAAPVVLLVTDNFLRRWECMSMALPMLQQLLRTNRVLPVVADGHRPNPATGQPERVETHFERVIHAISYMNYWQSVYLEVRQKLDHAAPGEAEQLERELKTVREVSVEIGDFLNTLRNADHAPWAAFSANHFELFFRRFGLTELYQKYRVIAAADPAEADEAAIFFEKKNEEAAPVLTQNGFEKAENAPAPAGFDEKREAAPSAAAPPAEVVDVPVLAENEPVAVAASGAFFEKREAAQGARVGVFVPSSWEKQAGPPPEFLPEEPPFWGEPEADDRPLFETSGYDIMANLDESLDEKAARAAARSRKKKLAIALNPAPGQPVAPEKKAPSKKKASDPSPVAEDKAVASPVEEAPARKPAPIPPEPTREEIEKLVAEIVREEASRAEAQAALSTTTQPEAADQPEPFSEKEGAGAEEIFEQKRGEGPLPTAPPNPQPAIRNPQSERPVAAMQLPHFQPVSAVSEMLDDIRISQTDARFWMDKGELAEARAQAEEVAMRYPQRPEGWSLLGEVAEAGGEFAAARHYWEKALLCDEDDAGAHLRLARMLDQHFKTEKKDAVRHYRAAARLDPADVASLYRAGAICLENLGKHDKARRFFLKTVEREPRHAAAWYDLAHLERHLGNPDGAADAYQKATALDASLWTEVEARLFERRTADGGWRTADGDSFSAEDRGGPEAVEIFEENDVAAGGGLSQKEAQLIENQSVGAGAATVFPEKREVLTVLITGATSGIGRATADLFAKNGHRLIITGRREERLNELEADFRANYQNEVLTACFDVRDRAAAEAVIDALPEEWRDIDLLVNNAGLAKGLDPVHEARLDHWEEMIDTNLKGLLYMTRLVAPAMVARRRGHIINVGSIAGKEVYPKGGVYNATKFAVDALTRAMRLDLVPHGLRVSSVSPGAVEETEFSLVRFDGDGERAARTYDNFRPLTSGDVAEAIYFMATRPPHVAIHDITLTGAQQASATLIDRSGR